MNRLASSRVWVAVFAAALTLAATVRATELDNSLFQVLVAYQKNDPRLPWQKEQPAMRQGYAVAIDDARLITTEDLVRNGTLIEIRRARTGEKIAVTVEGADYQVNAAILRVLSRARAGRFTPLALATNVPVGAQVDVAQFDETGTIREQGGTIQRVSVSRLPQAMSSSLSFTALSDMNVNGPAAPVLRDGALVGLMMQFDRNAGSGDLLPYPVLKRFLDDMASSPYSGCASAGFMWAALVDPVKREFLGVAGANGGILVFGTLPGTGAAECLKPGDVVLEWDGRPIDNLGYYNDAEFGRLLIPYLIGGRRHPGEAVPLTIVRNRATLSVTLRLSRRLDADALVPENILGETVPYVADGGFVIRELTGDYLRSQGSRRELQANPRLVHLYLEQTMQAVQPKDRVVILSRVLPDPINVGSHDIRDEMVTAVNGREIRNMADVFRTLDADGSLKRITLKGVEVDIVIDQGELAAANRRIAERYNIPNLRRR